MNKQKFIKKIQEHAENYLSENQLQNEFDINVYKNKLNDHIYFMIINKKVDSVLYRKDIFEFYQMKQENDIKVKDIFQSNIFPDIQQFIETYQNQTPNIEQIIQRCLLSYPEIKTEIMNNSVFYSCLCFQNTGVKKMVPLEMIKEKNMTENEIKSLFSKLTDENYIHLNPDLTIEHLADYNYIKNFIDLKRIETLPFSFHCLENYVSHHEHDAYFILIPNEEQEFSFVPVTTDLLDLWNIDESTLFQEIQSHTRISLQHSQEDTYDPDYE